MNTTSMGYESQLSITEKVASLFQPDILLTARYLETLRTRALEPEQRLMLAILEDAVHCFQKYISAGDRRRKGLFRDAEEWIMEEDDDWVFSFDNVCHALGLNPAYLRQGLLRWRRKKLPYLRLVRKAEGRSPDRIPRYNNRKTEGAVAEEASQEKKTAQL